jgi:hypothetical protein
MPQLHPESGRLVRVHRPTAVYVGGAPADAPRYKVIASVPEGYWGGRGQITPLAAILSRLGGHDAEQARTLAAQRIAATRAEHARLP